MLAGESCCDGRLIRKDESLPRPGSSSPSKRLAAFYAAFFIVIGVNQPFWPLWLAHRGLDAAEIGIVLGAGIFAKVIGLPLAAHVADRSGERQRLMLALALASAIAWSLFSFTQSFWTILSVSLLFFSLWPPVMSLGESLTMHAAGKYGFEYGRVRLWGSLAYIATALAGGWLLSREPASVVFWMTLSGIVLTMLICTFLPDSRLQKSGSRGLPLLRALAEPRFGWMLVSCGLIQGSHAVYYAFATLHWQQIGLSEDVIGRLWALGVVCEVVLFATGSFWLRKLGAGGLITMAALAAVVRWLGTGATAWLPAIAVFQVLHGLSFGGAHLGAMYWISGNVPPSLSASAQSLYSGVVWGMFLGILLFSAGELYSALGGFAFYPMAAVAVVGTLSSLMLLRVRKQPSSPSQSRDS